MSDATITPQARQKSPMQELRDLTQPETEETKDTCEFGSGWAYCLGLFLAHAWKLGDELNHYSEWRKKAEGDPIRQDLYSERSAMEMWAQGAGDHMIEFKPELGPPHLVDRAVLLRNNMLALRFSHLDGSPDVTKEDVFGYIREAKELLRELDIHNGVPTLIAEWD